MKRGHRWLIGLAVVLALWAAFTCPLPRYVLSGIPSSDRNLEKHHVRAMISGDHLQLLYHFWLVEDMFRGQTPPFTNLYEFNTGDDAARYKLDPYYAPFSLVYAATSRLGGRAFGWNLAGFVSLLLTFVPMWVLVRRYVRSEGVAALAALLAFALPYRWITLLTGSPTGFAMGLVPVTLLGLDTAVRDDNPWGGLAAGLGVLLAYCSDLHVFFFSVLVMPFWCLAALAARDAFGWRSPRAYVRTAVALLPTVVLLGVAVVLSMAVGRDFVGTDMEGGRALREVARFSPVPRGLFSWANMGVSNHVFFGYALVATLAVCAVAQLAAFVRRPAERRRRSAVFVLVVLAILGVVSLALGVNGPFDGALLLLCRKVVPRYEMIRQPVKIYCLLAPLVAVAVGLGFAALYEVTDRRLALACMCLGVAAVGAESRLQVSPTICTLRASQAAYEAVALDAAGKGRPARALAIPIWPGDSHYTSLYQYYASLYRVRLVNGYSPIIDRDYFTDIFKRFESVNQGVLDDLQLRRLREMGIYHVLFHEGPFPEKVSPFPASFTLQRLLNHPRLELVRRDGLVWAFRITDAPVMDRAVHDWSYVFSTRRWEAETSCDIRGVPADDAEASGGQYVKVSACRVGLATRAMANAPDLRLFVRARGGGILKCRMEIDGETGPETIVTCYSSGWAWMPVPIRTEKEYFRLTVYFSHIAGDVDVDVIQLAAGQWLTLEPGEEAEIPATCFFRAGYTEPEDGAVVFLKDAEADRTILYGPGVPLNRGLYEVRVDFDAEADEGTVLGWIDPAQGLDGERVPIVAGEVCAFLLDRLTNDRWSLNAVFTRNADLTIRRIAIKRHDEAPAEQEDEE